MSMPLHIGSVVPFPRWGGYPLIGVTEQKKNVFPTSEPNDNPMLLLVERHVTGLVQLTDAQCLVCCYVNGYAMLMI